MRKQPSQQMPSAFAILRKAEYFAIGLVGYGGIISQEEEALRRLVNADRAELALFQLLRVASPAGKMYALLGLHLLNSRYIETAYAPFSRSEQRIPVVEGCVRGEETAAAIVRKIRARQYTGMYYQDAELYKQQRGI